MNKHLEDLQNHLRTARHPSRSGMTKSILCNDGFRMSVQASESHYCSPRNNSGPWTEVEIGFPLILEPLLFDYAETKGQWTNTVYPYVPIELAAAVIEVHGGLVEE